MLTLSGSNAYSGNTAVSGGTLQISAGQVSTGQTTVDGGVLQLTGGQLTSPTQYVGNSSTGSFVQSGGTNLLSSNLNLGYNPGASGSYTLSGGSLSASNIEYVGYSGSGNFTQSGGTNAVYGIYLGYSSRQQQRDLQPQRRPAGHRRVSVEELPEAAAFNFGGGTLGASSPWSSSLNMTLTGLNGPATVDTTGGNISLLGHPQRQRRFDQDRSRHAHLERLEHLFRQHHGQRRNATDVRRAVALAEPIRRQRRRATFAQSGGSNSVSCSTWAIPAAARTRSPAGPRRSPIRWNWASIPRTSGRITSTAACSCFPFRFDSRLRATPRSILAAARCKSAPWSSPLNIRVTDAGAPARSTPRWETSALRVT